MCFKIIVDFSNPELFADFYNAISQLGDTVFAKDVLYIWVNADVVNKSSILKIIKEAEIEEYICKEVTSKDFSQSDGFVYSWLLEKEESEKQKKLEKEKQEDLQKMLQNINEVENLLKNYAKN